MKNEVVGGWQKVGSVRNLGLPTVPWEPLSPKGICNRSRTVLRLPQSAQAFKSGWQTTKRPINRTKYAIKLILWISDNILRFKNKETRLYEKTTQDYRNHIFLTTMQLLFGSDKYQQPLLNPCPTAICPPSCIPCVGLGGWPSPVLWFSWLAL